MRCAKAQRWLSDEIDGALGPGPRARLEAHLRACPACRAYGQRLSVIHGQGRLAGERTPEAWTAFERSLEARLDAAEPGGRRGARPFPGHPRWAWAWAAAPALILVAAAAWYMLRPAGAPAAEGWAGYDDVLSPLVAAAEADSDLAGRIDREIGAMMDEMAPAPDGEAVALPAADPLFWEGLSEDDLKGIVGELERESGNGGPA